jgi:hypothetical protein
MIMIRPASPRPAYWGIIKNIETTTPAIQIPSSSFASWLSCVLTAIETSLLGV